MVNVFKLKGRLIALAVAALFVACSAPAKAQFSVNSPSVEQGELEIETHGSFATGLPKGGVDNADTVRYGQELEIGYGVTSFWQAQLGMTLQKPDGLGFQANSVDFTNIFQLAKVERWNATFGLQAGVSRGIAHDEPDEVQFGPLVQFGDEDSGLTFNGLFGKTFGPHREEGLGFEYAAQLKVPVRQGLGAGVEAFGDIGDIGHTAFDDTQLRLGPALFFSFGEDKDKDRKGKGDDDDKEMKGAGKEPDIESAIGVLFGATDATPDLTVKWDLEVSF